MDNGYLIAFVVVAALSIGVLRYRNRVTLRQAERNEPFLRPLGGLQKDREGSRSAHMRRDIRSAEDATVVPRRGASDVNR